MTRVKNYLVILVFALALTSLPLLMLFLPAQEVSSSERRPLAQWPRFSTKNVLAGTYMTKVEDYALDHFPGRDGWRTIKAYLRLHIFRQKENNGLSVQAGSIYKKISLDEKSARQTTVKIKKLIDSLPDTASFYISLIPDKSYYLGQGEQKEDFDRLEEIVMQMAGPAEYISIKALLAAESYYQTDLHWRQTELGAVLERLIGHMQAGLPASQSYSREDYTPFYGAYYGQLALPYPADHLSVLTNKRISSGRVSYFDPKSMSFSFGQMYDADLFGSIDPYNIYLGGPQALVRIENDQALTDKELLVFRDSFASSLAPLLSEFYSRISLVDLRYINSQSALQQLDFSDQVDVLFLYGSLIMNDSTLFLVK